jgi:glutamate N-acetyltransferase/amino-acid N-acetyltransferase
MAVGRADQPVKREKIRVTFGPLTAARDGAVAPGYSEATMSDYEERRA